MQKVNETLENNPSAREIIMAPGKAEFTVTRVINAPRGLVFEAWTKPEHLLHWWGSDNCRLQACEVDLRPGGAYRFRMGAPGEHELWVSGIYHEILAPELIVFSCGLENEEQSQEAIWSVTFIEEGGKTRVTVHQVLVDAALADSGAEQGLKESLQRLAVHLEMALVE